MKGVAANVIDAGFEPGDFTANMTGWPEPSAFLQWKGTNVCMDFHCECGAFCHFDGYSAYTIRCPHCKTVWEMPSVIYPRKADHRTYEFWRDNPKELEPDEDYESGSSEND
jgi:hypothetical protein